MKRSRFSEEQIIAILKEHEAGLPVADLCRKHGVSDASIYKWKARYGGMDVSEARRLKTLEEERQIKISMDGKGAWRDNVFVERLWRTIKYEEVYLRAYSSVPEARASLARYIGFYNGRRPHSSLDGKTPDQAYFNLLEPVAAAA